MAAPVSARHFVLRICLALFLTIALVPGGFAQNPAQPQPPPPPPQVSPNAKGTIRSAVELVQVDADILEELLRGSVVTQGRLHIQRAAVQGKQAATVTEFVALGVPSEVVMIVEDKHPGASSHFLRKKYPAARPLRPPPTTTKS